MKKTVTLFASMFIGVLAFAQMSVTYRVDISDYVAGGATVDPTGMRLAGNFSTTIGSAGGTPMAEWSPTIGNAAMTDMGGNIWSLVVNYPASSVGVMQQFLFINGNWGANEGLDPLNTIVSAGCGNVNASGQLTRTLELPSVSSTMTYCWNNCTAVCGAGLSEMAVANVLVSPNPTSDIVNVKFDLKSASDATFTLVDLTGKVLMTKEVTSGISNAIDVAAITAGSYIYTISAGDNLVTGKLIKK